MVANIDTSCPRRYFDVLNTGSPTGIESNFFPTIIDQTITEYFLFNERFLRRTHLELKQVKTWLWNKDIEFIIITTWYKTWDFTFKWCTVTSKVFCTSTDCNYSLFSQAAVGPVKNQPQKIFFSRPGIKSETFGMQSKCDTHLTEMVKQRFHTFYNQRLNNPNLI